MKLSLDWQYLAKFEWECVDNHRFGIFRCFSIHQHALHLLILQKYNEKNAIKLALKIVIYLELLFLSTTFSDSNLKMIDKATGYRWPKMLTSAYYKFCTSWNLSCSYSCYLYKVKIVSSFLLSNIKEVNILPCCR